MAQRKNAEVTTKGTQAEGIILNNKHFSETKIKGNVSA